MVENFYGFGLGFRVQGLVHGEASEASAALGLFKPNFAGKEGKHTATISGL